MSSVSEHIKRFNSTGAQDAPSVAGLKKPVPLTVVKRTASGSSSLSAASSPSPPTSSTSDTTNPSDATPISSSTASPVANPVGRRALNKPVGSPPTAPSTPNQLSSSGNSNDVNPTSNDKSEDSNTTVEPASDENASQNQSTNTSTVTSTDQNIGSKSDLRNRTDSLMVAKDALAKEQAAFEEEKRRLQELRNRRNLASNIPTSPPPETPNVTKSQASTDSDSEIMTNMIITPKKRGSHGSSESSPSSNSDRSNRKLGKVGRSITGGNRKPSDSQITSDLSGSPSVPNLSDTDSGKEEEDLQNAKPIDAETEARVKKAIRNRGHHKKESSSSASPASSKSPARPPPKALKPRDYHATIRRIVQLPPINKADFAEEWDKFPNAISVEIVEEPFESIRPGECVAVKIKLVKCDDRSEIKIRSASYYRLATENGIVFQLKLQEGQVFLLLRLVTGDEELVLAHPGGSGVSNVLQTQEYIRSKNSSAYYRPKAHSVFNTPLGVHLDRNQLDLFIKIMIPSPADPVASNSSSPPLSPRQVASGLTGTSSQPFRILFNTINNQENEFTVTRKIMVSEEMRGVPKKTYLTEMLVFLKGIDARNVALIEKIRQIEKLNKDTDTVKQNALLKEVIGGMLDALPGVTSKQNYNGRTLLHYLCVLGFSDLVKFMVPKMKVPEINLLDINTRTALFMAIEAGHKGIVKTLLEKGATWHTKDTRGETVTDFALRAGHINILHLLNEVKQKKIAETTAGQGGSPSEINEVEDISRPQIHELIEDPNGYEALKKQVDILKRLSVGPGSAKLQTTIKGLKRVRPIDAINEDGATGLHIAAARGNLKALKLLINAGADINAKDDEGSTPLHQAVASRQVECVKALASADGIDLEARDATLATPLSVAATLDLLPIVEILVQKKARLDAGDERDFTPLHHACAYGYMETVQFLLDAGADPNAATLIDDTTPFQQAVFNGHHELVDLLLKHGADLSAGNDKALDLACLNGHTKCVEILLSHSANPNSTDFEMSTPAHKAALNGHLECLKLLAKAGAKMDAKDSEGATPLHKAAFAGNPKVVSYLLSQNNPPINERDNYQGTPVHNAAFSGHTEIVKLLVKAGAKLDLTEDLGAAPIHLAALNGHIGCVKAIIEGASSSKSAPNYLKSIIDKPDRIGMTALMHAVPYPEMITLLCTSGASPNLQDNEGRTAFFHAILKRYEASAKVLIEHGADPYLKNKLGQVPLDLVSNEFKDMINDAVKLRKQGGDAETDKKWKEAVSRFNTKPKEGIAYAVKAGLIEDTPDGIAMMLHKENETLDPQLMGELLSHRTRTELLSSFIKRLNFENMTLDEAMRQFLQKFLLPGEAQQIERVMEAFADRYVENNPGVFPNKDTCFIFAFGLIMLNTDAHNKNIAAERKMTKAQYIHNHRCLWGPNQENPPQEILEALYDSIIADEIKFRDSGAAEEKEGLLKKQGGSFGSWQTFWFMLKDQCLFYFRQKSDAEPVGLIPLENVVVKKKEGKKSAKFTLLAADGGYMKSCKMREGKIVQGTTHEITIMAEKPEEAEQWAHAIRGQIASNPFYSSISKRSAELADQQRGKGALYGVGAIVNFPEFYDLALLCDSCYGTENQIKKQYGTNAVATVADCRGVKLFLLRDEANKKQHIILVGNLWTEKVKRAEWDETFDWKEHFKIESTLEAIFNLIEDHLKKDFAIQITGHSLGALVACFLGLELQQRAYKLVKITTFGQPNFVTEKTSNLFRPLNILRILEFGDPVDSVFAGHFHVGHLVTLLSKNYFCYENKLAGPDSEPSSSPTNNDESGKKKGSIREKDPSWKEKRNLKTGLPVDTRLPAHTIDYYLKRLKVKLKGDTQYVEPAQKAQFK